MKKKIKLSSSQIVLVGFLGVILIGSLLLSLPVSSSGGEGVSYIDALFTATTATCVTGLVTVPTFSAWSTFGHIVILFLIQIGGLGVVTVTAGIMLIFVKKIGIGGRLIIMDAFNLSSLSGIIKFVKKVIAGTLIAEAAGAVLYMTVLVPEFGVKGIWYSVFNSISAFCNAGIDIIGENSLCDYVKNPMMNFVTSALIIAGGLGFIVWWDIQDMLSGKKQRRLRHLTLHTKIVLFVTAVLLLGGTVLLFVFEYNNPRTIGDFTLFEKWQASFFQSVTTRTAGFAALPQENLTNASAFLSIILMFTGGSPVGTAGGVKTVTVFVLILTAISVIKNKSNTEVFQRRIRTEAIKKSVAVFFFSFAVFFISTLLLAAVNDGDILSIMYETVSATATVGLTRSFTPSLNTAGKVIIIATMYLGRVGPISIAFAFKGKSKNENAVISAAEDITIG